MSHSVGRNADQNEDDIVAKGPIYGVLDGMGGHTDGGLAARLAAEVIGSVTAVTRRTFATLLTRCHQQVSEGISPGSSGGTTAVIAYVHGQKVWINHCGDSRAYRWRNGKLTQLTADHDQIPRILGEYGEPTDKATVTRVRKWISRVEERAERDRAPEAWQTCYHYRNLISQALGPEDFTPSRPRTLTWHPDDILILCTDGLHDNLSDRQITQLLRGVPAGHNIARYLVEAAQLVSRKEDNIRRKNDDISAVVIAFS